MRNIEKLTEKYKRDKKTPKTRKKLEGYVMPLKARLIMNCTVVAAMLFAPLLWIFSVFYIAVTSIWGAFIDMPLEVKEMILEEFIKSGIAKKRVKLNEG